MMVYLMPPNYTLRTLEGVRMVPHMLYIYIYITTHTENKTPKVGRVGVCVQGRQGKKRRWRWKRYEVMNFCFVLRRE